MSVPVVTTSTRDRSCSCRRAVRAQRGAPDGGRGSTERAQRAYDDAAAAMASSRVASDDIGRVASDDIGRVASDDIGRVGVDNDAFMVSVAVIAALVGIASLSLTLL